MVICFMGSKGGVGRSTLALHCAQVWGQNERVSVVDADPKGTLRMWADIRESGSQGVRIVADTGDPAETIALLSPHCERIVLDCSASSPGDINYLKLCDFALLVSSSSPLDAWTLGGDIAQAMTMKHTRSDFDFAVLMNRYDQVDTYNLVRDLEQSGVPVIPSPIHENADVSLAMGLGKTVFETAPNGNAASEFFAASESITERIQNIKPVTALRRRRQPDRDFSLSRRNNSDVESSL